MKRGGILGKVLLVILCILLAGGLGYFLLQYRKEERAEAERLRQDAEIVHQQEERITPKPIPVETEEEMAADSTSETEADAASDIETAAESGQTEEETTEPEEAASVVSETDSETAESETADVETAESAPAESEAAVITMISCRGDTWQQGEDADRTLGWPAKLQKLLTEQGIQVTVFDGTWDMSGTLSQLSYAGVPLNVVSEYIRGHQEAGLSSVRTEMRVRHDLNRKYVERTDYDAIPVIGIGYRGGFGRNLEELVKQQRDLLETYNIPQNTSDDAGTVNDGDQGISGCYLILGRYPEGWVNQAGYDEAMTKAWGEHYVSLNELSGDVYSDEFRQGAANVIYSKLKEMGYLPE